MKNKSKLRLRKLAKRKEKRKSNNNLEYCVFYHFYQYKGIRIIKQGDTLEIINNFSLRERKISIKLEKKRRVLEKWVLEKAA